MSGLTGSGDRGGGYNRTGSVGRNPDWLLDVSDRMRFKKKKSNRVMHIKLNLRADLRSEAHSAANRAELIDRSR